MWKSTRSKTKSESELSKSESDLSWLLICSDPSCWNWHPPLLFTLFSLKAIGGHKPHYWCLVEFGFAVQNKICLAGCDSYCFINLLSRQLNESKDLDDTAHPPIPPFSTLVDWRSSRCLPSPVHLFIFLSFRLLS